MGNSSSTPKAAENNDHVKIPAFTLLDENEGDSVSSLNVDLPQGIKITGGVKLRDAGYTGKGVKVAVIDSGVDKDHPGFNDKVIKQVWYRDGTPLSIDSHGTHVAGTVHLMAPDAEIYDYRVFGETGKYSIVQAIVLAIDQAVADGCAVINMSLGGPSSIIQVRNAVRRAYAAGVIVVCAAGNEGDDNPLTNEISWPGAYEECINIAAVEKADGLPVAVFSNSNNQVDYAGIGVNVLSLWPGGSVQRLSGTSMASPHVAGLVACILSKNKTDDRPDDEVITTDPGCCGLCGNVTDVSDNANSASGVFEEVKDDATLRKLLNETFLVDIGVTGPDNETGLGFLSYLSKDELVSILDTL